MRVALCHEWLAARRGSEKTFEAMASALAGADLFALTLDPSVPFDLGRRRVRTTFLDRLPAVRTRRSVQLPLMPLAWRYATRGRYDLVITSSHACAKGFRPGRDALHLCYCYTPMRYVWLASVDERTARNPLTIVPEGLLRAWDRRSAGWVDEFAAISGAVRDRIDRFYGRHAEVIHPPVDTGWFTPGVGPRRRREAALVVSRLVRYKRVDLAIDACHALRYPLVVAGSGPEEAALRARAAGLGADVTFVVDPGDEQLRDLYRTARVLVYPAVEDFGIVVVEAQACGTPVVALAEGGTAETVLPGETGALVAAQDATRLAEGLASVLALPADATADACRANAERFSTPRFVRQFRDWVSGHAARRGLSVDLAAVG